MDYDISDFDTFEVEWKKLDDDEKVDLVSQAGELELSEVILPVLIGIKSYHFSVRSSARKSLEILKAKVNKFLKTKIHDEGFLRGMKSLPYSTQGFIMK